MEIPLFTFAHSVIRFEARQGGTFPSAGAAGIGDLGKIDTWTCKQTAANCECRQFDIVS